MSYSNRFIILIFNPKVTYVHGAMLEIFQTNIVYKEVIHLGFRLEQRRAALSYWFPAAEWAWVTYIPRSA